MLRLDTRLQLNRRRQLSRLGRGACKGKVFNKGEIYTSGLKLDLLVDCEDLELPLLIEVLEAHLRNVSVDSAPVRVVFELPTVS